jgi:hypothetical protein
VGDWKAVVAGVRVGIAVVEESKLITQTLLSP